MALKSTVYKAELSVADMDRHYYATHNLTLAMHPSETEERLMVRVLAFALHANEALTFGRGLSSDDEPDLWQKDLTGAIELWIQVGQPDEKWLRKACGRARQVWVYCYAKSADIWWEQNRRQLERLENLTVIQLSPSTTEGLAAMAQRSMQLQASVQDGQLWLADANQQLACDYQRLMGPG